MNRALALAGLLALAACTPAQLEEATLYQARIAGACSVAMTLAPVAGLAAPWIIGACGTEAAIARIALDPSTLAWINDLVAKLRR
jgi:hypothetical protein